MPTRPTPRPMSVASYEANESEVDFHKGEALYHAASTYPSLPLTLVEGAQNGMDADAKHVFIGISLFGNHRTVIIADDGTGVTREKFEQALRSVYKGIKAKDRLGRFGLGLISPLDKCKSFTFTSQSITGGPVHEWKFEGLVIKSQHEHVTVPRRVLSSLPQVPNPFAAAAAELGVTWRTIVRLNGVSQAKVHTILDLDEVGTLIRDKLGDWMRRQNVNVRLLLVDERGRQTVRDVPPLRFTGQPLPVTRKDDPALPCGLVEFELYRAPQHRGVRSGSVHVMELDGSSPISWTEFMQQARHSRWYSDVQESLNILGSGYFEGVIRAKNITLHQERTKFVNDDALWGLYVAMDSWMHEYGRTYYENEQELRREERYQNLGLQSMERLHALLQRPEFARLLDGFELFTIGRLGATHLDPSKGKPGGAQEQASVRVGQGGQGVKRDPNASGSSGERGERTREPHDRPGDTPLGVVGPRGQKRTYVKNDSIGLQFSYEYVNSSRLWELDFQYGILTFNVRHPVWVKLDETNGKHAAKNDRWIMHLQEWLTLQVLHLLRQHPDAGDFEQARDFIDGQLKHYVEMFITVK